MRLAPDTGLRSIVLGVEGVEVLFEPLVGRDPGVDRAANSFRSARLHDRSSFDVLSRKPKNRRPFQRVPVTARAICDRLGELPRAWVGADCWRREFQGAKGSQTSPPSHITSVLAAPRPRS